MNSNSNSNERERHFSKADMHELVEKLLREGVGPDVRIRKDVLSLCTSYVYLFICETLHRAASYQQSVSPASTSTTTATSSSSSSSTVQPLPIQVEHVEAILPQLLLDF
mmetsp:Transcript_23909/g.59815  ORF Transcript_23909/g.59815 Transcript_23909/m.59815 type:complete len:109 (-) Transcript_23909:1841-2167(-)